MAVVIPGFQAQRAGDAAVILRSRQEPECFAEVFDRYYGQIHDYAARRLGQGLADDVAAETFLIAFTRRERYDLCRPDARPWLYGIASNLISRHCRAEARWYRALARAGTAGGGESPVDRADAWIDAQAQRARLAAALAQVGAGDREVLLLVAWGGLTAAEAGQALGIPAGTARSRLHRARHQIRAVLAQPGPAMTWKDDRSWMS